MFTSYLPAAALAPSTGSNGQLSSGSSAGRSWLSSQLPPHGPGQGSSAGREGALWAKLTEHTLDFPEKRPDGRSGAAAEADLWQVHLRRGPRPAAARVLPTSC